MVVHSGMYPIVSNVTAILGGKGLNGVGKEQRVLSGEKCRQARLVSMKMPIDGQISLNPVTVSKKTYPDARDAFQCC